MSEIKKKMYIKISPKDGSAIDLYVNLFDSLLYTKHFLATKPRGRLAHVLGELVASILLYIHSRRAHGYFI